MKIKGKVHCFFEQSGTFKNEFIKLGIPAEDYDIQNNFGETDHVTDLFKAIEDAYDGKPSLFDAVTKDDLIMAFFPCIYFCCTSQTAFRFSCINYRKLTFAEKTKKVLERNENRNKFYSLLIKMFCVVNNNGLRMVVENPWSEDTYLKSNFILPPTIIDRNRMKRGDFRVKPTAYWFVGFSPSHSDSYQNDKEKRLHMKMKSSKKPGVCSEDRSMIHPDYARNFICDFILGGGNTIVPQQIDMFDELNNGGEE